MNTSKKITLIVIVVFTLIIIGLFFAYQSFVADKDQGVEFDKDGRETLFPASPLFGGENGERGEQGDFIPTLRQISSSPTSGGILFNTENEVVVRYVERATGHIFETTNKSLEQNRISNTTIPRIQESVWSPDGSMVILRYLDENEVLKSFYGKVSDDVGKLDGWFLSNSIIGIDVHEDGDIFYIQKVAGGVQGIISNFDGTNSKTVFSSIIYDWSPQWMGDSVALTTKTARDIDGFLYKLQSGYREKILSIHGLVATVSPDGLKVLFSASNANETKIFIYDNEKEELYNIPFRTLAEKCAWASNSTVYCASPYNEVRGIVPDDWYKGTLSFSDDIWLYSTETKTAQLVYDAGAEEKVFDAINLTTDKDGKMLLFTNKNDLTMWALSLE